MGKTFWFSPIRFKGRENKVITYTMELDFAVTTLGKGSKLLGVVVNELAARSLDTEIESNDVKY